MLRQGKQKTAYLLIETAGASWLDSDEGDMQNG